MQHQSTYDNLHDTYFARFVVEFGHFISDLVGKNSDIFPPTIREKLNTKHCCEKLCNGKLFIVFQIQFNKQKVSYFKESLIVVA